MEKLLFEKFNNNRVSKYQTVTRILEDQGKKRVVKEALCEEAKPHLLSFDKKYALTSAIYKDIKFLPCEIQGDTVVYPFVMGKTLDEEIAPLLSDLQSLNKKLHELFEGPLKLESEVVNPVNLDMILDNIIIDSNGDFIAYDYEWVLEEDTPAYFVYYRILSRLYDKYFHILQPQTDFDKWLPEFGIKEKELEDCLDREKSFIEKIYGKQPEVQTPVGQAPGLKDKLKATPLWKLTKPARVVKHMVDDSKEKERRKPFLNYELSGEEFSYNPTISILTPLFNTPEKYLKEMINSVTAQSYKNWQLCLVDFSDEEHGYVEKVCKKLAKKWQGISYVKDPENKGISENTNTCMKYAIGEYIAILDHDDLLHPAALYQCVKAINEGADFIYSDEIKFKETPADAYAPNYKSDFSLEELRAHNFICHLNVFKKSLVDKVGGYRVGFDGSQDHDMVLRLTEAAENIVHLPMLLYFWRVHEASVASNIAAKPYATISGIKACNESYERAGYDLKVDSIRDNIPCYRLTDLKPQNKSLHVIIFGSGSDKQIEKTLASLKECREVSFSYSIVNGLLTRNVLEDVANRVDSEEILVLKAGLTFESRDAITELENLLNIKEVSFVDSRINYVGGDTTFSAGLVAGKNLLPNVSLRLNGKPAQYEGFETMLIHIRQVSGISGMASLLKRRDLLEALEGDKAAQSLQALSINSNKKSIFCPYCVLCGAELSDLSYIQNLGDQIEGIGDTDPYFPEAITRCGLE